MSHQVKLAQDAAEIRGCHAVMSQLRPHLDLPSFEAQVALQRAQGYQLAFLADAASEVKAVAGFRVLEMLVSGRTLYIDDLVTSESGRSRGHGKQLLYWLADYARADGCKVLSLDSGVQRTRAHKFYFVQGLTISSFHFQIKLRD